ncbi:MAG: hypothetical protein VB120_04990 [Lachnospiraceae bacterium]|nr:hypothetical protein [Lachnospiraceae bacterium]
MFLIYSSLNGAVAPTEYYSPTSGETISVGEALKMTSGALTKASGTDKPIFVCVGAARGDGFIPVSRVTEDIEFETLSSATVATSLVGSKVTMGTDGLGVTATTTNGVFQISYTDGATTNSKVRGYFK